MTDVRRNLQKWFTNGKTIPGFKSSHHFTPLSPSLIGHVLTSEDDQFIDTFDFNLPTTLQITDICMYNSFWSLKSDITVGDPVQFCFQYFVSKRLSRIVDTSNRFRFYVAFSLLEFLNVRQFSLRHWNTGLVSSGASLASWGEGASLALVDHPSSDGVKVTMPYRVDVLHRPALNPIFSYWVG